MKKLITILLMTAIASVACDSNTVDKNRDALEGQHDGTNNGNPGDENGIPPKDTLNKDSVR